MTGAAVLEADIEIDASPHQVWSVVSDIARMGEWSPECRKVMVFGATRKGAHVVGLNRRRWTVWPTNSRIVRYEPGRAIAWRVYENRATWSYELEPAADGGTHLIERRTLPPAGIAPVSAALAKVFLGGVDGHDSELLGGMNTTLERIKAEVERD